MNYARHFNTKATPQREQAKPGQVKNSAGGYVFQLDPWKQLERWLVLGAEGGTYYATERELTRDNAKTVLACLDTDHVRAVQTIVEVSDAGRAPKNDPAIFALALAAAHDKPEARAAALEALSKVCRTGTHLFQFVEAVGQMRGWGRGLRSGVSNWYTSQPAAALMRQVTKYAQRGGMSHRDVLRLAHPQVNLVDDPEVAKVLRYVVAGADGMGVRDVKNKDDSFRQYMPAGELPPYLAAFEELKHADEKRTIALIHEHGFTHEMIDTRHKNSADVWAALLDKMPMTAMVRNLAKMTAVGLLKPMSDAARTVQERLGDVERIKKARMHPIQVLSALMVYRQGKGEKGSLTWSPVAQIVDSLDEAFYSAFQAIEPSGKRTLLAIDVSGSMDLGTIAGVPGLTPRLGAACMAMVTARAEKNWHCVGFSHRLVDVPITPRMRLDEVVRTMSAIPMGGTDCALPMQYAAGNSLNVDVFATYTDSETWFGNTHPFQALKAYRAKSGISAKSAVIAFTATAFTIADPSDANMMDLVGFDSAAPSVLANFSRD